jgi:hypothetical protein
MVNKQSSLLGNMRPLAGNSAPSSHQGMVVPTPEIDTPKREALRDFDPEIERGVMDVVRAKQ